MKKLKILVAGGGTGGHLFPGMAIAQAFEKKFNAEVRFVGTKRGIENKQVPNAGYHLYRLWVQGLYRVGAIKKMISLIKIPFAFLQAIGIILTFRPSLVIGVGGYASGPMLLISYLLGCRIILQEQNASPGMTNRILGKLAPLSFVPFKGLEGVFKNPVIVGNPIRQQILSAAKQTPSREGNPFTIAVVGGSQGAKVLNDAMVGLVDKFAEHHIRVIHQTGSFDVEAVGKLYKSIDGLDAEALVFIEDMAGLYQKSDLIFARSGSMVNELNAMGKASILVPIPFSSGDHQRQNAIKMVEAGAAILIEQAELSPETLWAEILPLLNDKTKLAAMEEKARGLFAGDAAAAICEKSSEFYQLESKYQLAE